jgi:hypothetical protein
MFGLANARTVRPTGRPDSLSKTRRVERRHGHSPRNRKIATGPSEGERNVLSKNERVGDEVVARLKLDVRELTLLYESDADLRPVLERSLLESQDGYVMRFVSLLQSRRPSADDGSLAVATGEIVLASFLAIFGLAGFMPVMAGLSTPQQWLAYFSSAIGPSLTNGPLYFGVPLLDFVFSAMLLLGAFYSLRRAAKNLKNAGLILESGRS